MVKRLLAKTLTTIAFMIYRLPKPPLQGEIQGWLETRHGKHSLDDTARRLRDDLDGLIESQDYSWDNLQENFGYVLHHAIIRRMHR